MMKRSILLAGLVIIAFASFAMANTITIEPTDDMYTDPVNPGPPEVAELHVANFAGGCGTYYNRIMFKFDLSDISGVVVDNAVLSMWRYWRCPNDYYTVTDLYAISQDWDEDTWPFSQHIQHDPTSWLTYTFGPHLGWYHINVTDLVQAWIDGDIENNGLVIKARWQEKCSRFYSKDHTNPNVYPSLEVTYTCSGVDGNPPSTTHLTLANYPNPFNPSTEIVYTLPENCWVRLKVYNILGQRVADLVDQYQPAGRHSVYWESETCGGTYFCRIQAGRSADTQKMILLK